MKYQRTIATVVSAAVFATFLTGPAAALNRVVTIVNDTSYTIVEFYGSNKGSDDWEEDILGYDVLGAYQSVDIDFDDGTGYCIFDFKAIFDDGEELEKFGVNVCEIGTFTYN